MEPKPQVEIQLGHMCNNRCVFCVSGQETALGRALPLDVAPILAEIERAHAAGSRKITLLGGEPTLQPGFLDVVKRAVALQFDEIVIFTNGVKTARAAFLDEIRATGGNFTWRISIQGATKEAHEATTKKPGSFDRIVKTMDLLHERGERITVNMCVVQSNYASIPAFPALLLPRGVTQLHLDMVRPLDAGARTEEELRAMIPRYSDMVPALAEMIRGFPEGFDVNIGNLPYCIAPELARSIHHDGERTLTISVDNGTELSRPWDKYLVKRRDKSKPASCGACAFEARCSGVFEAYRAFYGVDELTPIGSARLAAIDPDRRMLALHLRPLVAALLAGGAPMPFTAMTARETGDTEVTLMLDGAEPLSITLGPPGEGVFGFERMSARIQEVPRDPATTLEALHALAKRIALAGERAIYPIGEDAVMPVSRSVGARLARLRKAAPFAALSWDTLAILDGGRRAEIGLVAENGERATLWIAEQNGKPIGGYDVASKTPSREIVEGIRAAIQSLSAPQITETDTAYRPPPSP